MHCVNASVFFPYINQQSFLSNANKARLLEWIVRTDLALYVACGSTPLNLDETTDYKPNHPTPGGTDPWPQLFARVVAHEDDGHGVKMLRALRAGKEISADWEQKRSDFKIRGDVWDKIAHAVIDSIEGPADPMWVRNPGFEEAWAGVPHTRLSSQC
jgi:hypothetical protein